MLSVEVRILGLALFGKDAHSGSDIVEVIKITCSKVDQDPIIEANN